jgi:DNA-binding CsgD family transcriptional regulator
MQRQLAPRARALLLLGGSLPLLARRRPSTQVIVIAVTASCCNGHGSSGHDESRALPEGSLRHPSRMGPRGATESAAPRPLSVVKSGGQDAAAGDTLQAPPLGTLTPRQLSVLSLMAKGLSNGYIGRSLGYSESTIRQETMKIYRALQVKGRPDAIDIGRAHGLIPSTP